MKWQTKPIGKFCRTGSGGTPSRKQASEFYGGSIPWVKSGELKESIVLETEETITEAALAKTSVKLVPPGALLVAMYGATVGRIAILGIEATTNQAVCHIIPDESIADQRYMFYALRTQVPRWLEQRVGGAQPNISQQIIRDTQILLPPLEEQRRLAAILDKADAVRYKRQQAIQLTEELLRATFLDMFGDPVTNPKGWTQNKLGELVSIVSGQVDPQTQPYIDMPHVGVENIQANTGRISGVQTPRELRLKSGKYLFEPSYVLYSKIRPYLNKVAIPGFTGICSADIYPLSVNESQLDQKYLIYLLRSNIFLSYAEKHSARTNIPKINRSALLEFILPNPPLELQKEFSEIYSKVHGIEEKLEHGVQNSNNLFNSLLHRAFRGEL